MKKSVVNVLWGYWGRSVLLGMALMAGGSMGGAQTYGVGDTVEDFELVNRKLWFRDNGEAVQPGDPLRLSDFHGKIVFLEWFAYW